MTRAGAFLLPLVFLVLCASTMPLLAVLRPLVGFYSSGSILLYTAPLKRALRGF